MNLKKIFNILAQAIGSNTDLGLAVPVEYVDVFRWLGNYAQSEKELGTSILIVLKALQKGIFLDKDQEESYPCVLRMFHEEPMLVVNRGDGSEVEVYVKNYCKTWTTVKGGLKKCS